MKPTRSGNNNQPIQDFSDCHVGIVNMLEDLRRLSQQLVPVGQRREVAGRTTKFFQEVVTAHHSEEETDLFTAVLADATAGEERSKVDALVQQLVREHRRVEGLFGQLAPALSTLEHGGEVTLDSAAIGTLVDEYMAHARFEEEVFLPLAQTILGRNSDHMAALGLSMHIRHAAEDVRRKFGFI